MATQRSFVVSSVVWGLSLALLACGSESQSTQGGGSEADMLTSALLAGDGARVEALTNDVVAGRRDLDPRMLTDERSVAPSTVLRTTIDDKVWQLGVEKISEFGLCLLELQHHVSSEEILSIVAPAKRQVCTSAATPSQSGCEVCNAHAVPVPSDVRAELVKYWLSRDLK